ncbi:MAG: hypothetical protein ACTSPY_18350 [Candidatus Helarchaeota archaeon]
MSFLVTGLIGKLKESKVLNKLDLYSYLLQGPQWIIERNLRNYLRKGNFKSQFSFGLMLKNNKWYIVQQGNKVDKNIILGDYNLRINENKKEKIIVKDNNFEIHQSIFDFILTKIYAFLHSKGYTRPIEVRSFMNRFSKNVLSKRNELIERKSSKIKISRNETLTREFTLHEALSLKIFSFYTINQFILLIHPRYEVMENSLIFPYSNPKFSELKQDWTKYFKWDGKDLLKKSEKLLNLLKSFLQDLNFIEDINFSTNENLEFNFLKNLKFIFEENSIELSKHVKVDDFLRKNIFQKLKRINPLDINIYFDDNIENIYLEKIRNELTFQFPIRIIKEYNLENFLENSLDIKNPSLIILNNNLGYNGYHKVIKYYKLNYPHKIIMNSTLNQYYHSKNQDILIQIILPLIHRKDGDLIWKMDNQSFKIKIGIYLPNIYNRFISNMISCYNFNNKLKLQIEFIYKGNEEVVQTTILNCLSKILIKNQGNGKHLKILLMFYQMLPKNYRKIISNIEKNFDVSISFVVIDDINQGRILYTYDNLNDEFNPPRGLYIKIGKTQEKESYLLVTTGYPDISNKKNEEYIKNSNKEKENDRGEKIKVNHKKIGFTRPIRIDIYKRNNNNNDLEILEEIYNSSYLHPTSLTQTSLPIELFSVLKVKKLITFTRLNQEGIRGGIL